MRTGDIAPNRVQNCQMFTPTQNDVRIFFCAAWRKRCQNEPMDAMESLVSGWIQEHPEYHPRFVSIEAALASTPETSDSAENPFLHIAMHLSISEQCSIDQPRGIRLAVESLTTQLGDLHQAHHGVMDCLGQMIWESQRSGQPPDPHAYLDCVRRCASR